MSWTTFTQLSELSGEDQSALQALEAVLHVNRAAARLKGGRPGAAIHDCRVALTWNSENPKAMFRWVGALHGHRQRLQLHT